MVSAKKSVFSFGADLATITLVGFAAWTFVGVRSDSSSVPGGTVVDSTFAGLVANDHLGEPVTLPEISENNLPRIYFLFRSNCPACAAQKDSWITTARQASAAGIEVVALTTEVLDSAIVSYFGDDRKIPVLNIDFAGFSKFSTQVVPTTVIVGANGRVLFHHAGVIDEADERIADAIGSGF